MTDLATHSTQIYGYRKPIHDLAPGEGHRIEFGILNQDQFDFDHQPLALRWMVNPNGPLKLEIAVPDTTIAIMLGSFQLLGIVEIVGYSSTKRSDPHTSSGLLPLHIIHFLTVRRFKDISRA